MDFCISKVTRFDFPCEDEYLVSIGDPFNDDGDVSLEVKALDCPHFCVRTRPLSRKSSRTQDWITGEQELIDIQLTSFAYRQTSEGSAVASVARFARPLSVDGDVEARLD